MEREYKMQIKTKYHTDRQPIKGFVIKVLLLCVVLGLPGAAGYAADENYPSLRDSIDPQFQADFENALDKQFGQVIRDLVKAKKVGIVLADITDPHKPKVAQVNGDNMMYAASLPKIAIVLGVFVEIERGKMKLDEAKVYRKSGTWKQFHADSGVITEKDREYILVTLVEHEKGGEGLIELIGVVEGFLNSRAGQ